LETLGSIGMFLRFLVVVWIIANVAGWILFTAVGTSEWVDSQFHRHDLPGFVIAVFVNALAAGAIFCVLFFVPFILVAGVKKMGRYIAG
jgi:hypothetical protein